MSGDARASDDGGWDADEVDSGDDRFNANADIDCDSCSDDDDPNATSVRNRDVDGDSGGSVDDGVGCVDCDCGKSDFDDGEVGRCGDSDFDDGVGDGDVDTNADGSCNDANSVNSTTRDVVTDPDA